MPQVLCVYKTSRLFVCIRRLGHNFGIVIRPVAKNNHRVATLKASGYLVNTQLPVVAYKTVNLGVDRRLIRKFNAFTASALLVTLKPVCLLFPRMFSKLSISVSQKSINSWRYFFTRVRVFLSPWHWNILNDRRNVARKKKFWEICRLAGELSFVIWHSRL